MRGGQVSRPISRGRSMPQSERKIRLTDSTPGARQRATSRSSIRVSPVGWSFSFDKAARATSKLPGSTPVATKVPHTGNPRRLLGPSSACPVFTRRRSLSMGRPSRSSLNSRSAVPGSKRSPVTGRPRLCISQPMKRASPASSTLVRVRACAPGNRIFSWGNHSSNPPAAILRPCCTVAAVPALR